MYPDEKRVACVLLVDTSAGESIEELNKGLQAFLAAVQEDCKFIASADICVVTFDKEVKVVVPFCRADEFALPQLRVSGSSECAMNEAIVVGLDLIDVQKQAYKSGKVDFWKSRLILVSGCWPTDDENAAKAKKRLFDKYKMCNIEFYPVSLNDRSYAVLKGYTKYGIVLRPEKNHLKEVFGLLPQGDEYTETRQLCVLLIDTSAPRLELEKCLKVFADTIHSFYWFHKIEIGIVYFDDVVHSVKSFQCAKGLSIQVPPSKAGKRKAIEEAMITGMYLIRNRAYELDGPTLYCADLSWMFIFTDDENIYQRSGSFAHECIDRAWDCNRISCRVVYMGDKQQNLVSPKGYMIIPEKQEHFADLLCKYFPHRNWHYDDLNLKEKHKYHLTPEHPLYCKND